MDWTSIGVWIADNYPGLLLAFIAAIITYFSTRWYYKELKPIKNDVKHLPCSERGKTLDDIKDTLTIIRTYIATLDPERASLFSKKASPRKLNPTGEELLKNCKGVDFISDNKNILFGWLDAKNPKTALDLEKASFEILVENLEEDIFNPLKNWVYNSPSMKVEVDGETKDLAVSLRDVCFVISLPLRDIYLEQHPEIIEK